MPTCGPPSSARQRRSRCSRAGRRSGPGSRSSSSTSTIAHVTARSASRFYAERPARGCAGSFASFSDDASVERYTRRSAPGLVQGPGRATEEDHPPVRGATVFENSTACALFDRSLGREVCPGSTPPLERSPWGAPRTAVPELTPSCAPDPLCVLGVRLTGIAGWCQAVRLGLVPADRERKCLILPGTDP